MNLSLKTMSILVTGGCGYVGTHLTKELMKIKDFKKIILFDIVPPTFEYDHTKVIFIKGDIVLPNELEKAFKCCKIDGKGSFIIIYISEVPSNPQLTLVIKTRKNSAP